MTKKTKEKVSNCPICDSRKMSEMTSIETVTDRSNIEFKVEGYNYTVCDECGFDFVTLKQARANDQLLADVKRASSKLLRTHEIRTIRKKLDLRQEDASILFGGGANAFSKYERGYVTQSQSMDRLLRVADRFPEVILFLKDHVGMAVSAPKKTIIGRAEEVGFKMDNETIDSSDVRGIYAHFQMPAKVENEQEGGRWKKHVRRLDESCSDDESWTRMAVASNG